MDRRATGRRPRLHQWCKLTCIPGDDLRHYARPPHGRPIRRHRYGLRRCRASAGHDRRRRGQLRLHPGRRHGEHPRAGLRAATGPARVRHRDERPDQRRFRHRVPLGLADRLSDCRHRHLQPAGQLAEPAREHDRGPGRCALGGRLGVRLHDASRGTGRSERRRPGAARLRRELRARGLGVRWHAPRPGNGDLRRAVRGRRQLGLRAVRPARALASVRESWLGGRRRPASTCIDMADRRRACGRRRDGARVDLGRGRREQAVDVPSLAEPRNGSHPAGTDG